jgi:hypothetical protein
LVVLWLWEPGAPVQSPAFLLQREKPVEAKEKQDNFASGSLGEPIVIF